MQYILLIYPNEAEYDQRPASARDEITQEYMQLTDTCGRRISIVAGSACNP